jgi:hypothetical protein
MVLARDPGRDEENAMSTRSLIAMETERGIESVYCHSDGYPENHAPILSHWYTTEDAVRALMALGDLSILGREIGEAHDFNARRFDDTETSDWCLAYGRDRGQKETASHTHASEEALLAEARDRWGEYVYLFRAGRWLYRALFHDKGWIEIPVPTEAVHA